MRVTRCGFLAAGIARIAGKEVFRRGQTVAAGPLLTIADSWLLIVTGQAQLALDLGDDQQLIVDRGRGRAVVDIVA